MRSLTLVAALGLLTCVSWAGDDALSLYQEGMTALNQGHTDAASKKFQHLVDDFPTSPYAISARALMKQLGQSKKALADQRAAAVAQKASNKTINATFADVQAHPSQYKGKRIRWHAVPESNYKMYLPYGKILMRTPDGGPLSVCGAIAGEAVDKVAEILAQAGPKPLEVVGRVDGAGYRVDGSAPKALHIDDASVGGVTLGSKCAAPR